MIHDNSSQHESVSEGVGIRVGACHWDHEHWQKRFYPEDLPEDWRLSYYANEFSAVLLPTSVLRCNEEQLESWGEDAGEGFRFFAVEDTEPQPGVNTLSFPETFAHCFAGYVDLKSSKHTDIKIDKKSAVAVINVSSKDLRGWREWLQQNASGLRAIFLNDSSLTYQQLNDFKTLVELLNL